MTAVAIDPSNELSCIASIRPDQLQSLENTALLCFLQDKLGSVAILNVGSMDNEFKDETERINENMALASGDLLARVVTVMAPLFSVVFTDWLSMLPADGSGFFPAFLRTLRRSSSWTFFHVPSSDQIEK